MENQHPSDQPARRRSRDLSILNDVARTLNASVDLHALLEEALAKVVELLGLETGWVLLIDESVPPAVEVGLYRIAQEALQNALRHADAKYVTLRLRVDANGVRLTVDDDGCGFDADAADGRRAEDHFGLVGMRERARLLGGNLHVESSVGLGTRITAEVDLAGRSTSLE